MVELTGVCMVGYPCAGKTEANHVAMQRDIPTFSMGDLVRERVAEEHGVDARQDEDLVGRFATEQRAEHGQGVVAKWLINDLREFEQSNSESADVVLIDGLRSVDEMQVLCEELSEFLLVYVFAPFEDRIDRIIERGRGSETEFIGDDGVVDREKAVEYLSNRDAREDSWGLQKVVDEELYDIRVDNTESVEAFHDSIDRVLGEI